MILLMVSEQTTDSDYLAEHERADPVVLCASFLLVFVFGLEREKAGVDA